MFDRVTRLDRWLRDVKKPHRRRGRGNRGEQLAWLQAYLTGDPESAHADDHIKLDWKPVVVTDYPPTERKD